MDAVVSPPTTRDVRSTVRALREITARRADDQYYRVDRRNAAEYLWDRDDWKKLISEFFSQLGGKGHDIVFVDVCGRASARSMGATHNYSFSLQKVGTFDDNEDGSQVRGDIFNSRDFYSFVNLLRERGHFPAWVTCEPIVGLQSYAPYTKHGLLREQVVFQRLENNLRRMIEVVLPGGFIFLECPFQGMNLGDFIQKKSLEEYDSTLWLKDFCSRNKCSLRVKDSIVGPRFLLRKRGRRSK